MRAQAGSNSSYTVPDSSQRLFEPVTFNLQLATKIPARPVVKQDHVCSTNRCWGCNSLPGDQSYQFPLIRVHLVSIRGSNLSVLDFPVSAEFMILSGHDLFFRAKRILGYYRLLTDTLWLCRQAHLRPSRPLVQSSVNPSDFEGSTRPKSPAVVQNPSCNLSFNSQQRTNTVPNTMDCG